METVARRSVLARCARAHALAESASSVEEAVQRAAGIYGAAVTCYLSTAARRDEFDISDLQDALWSRRTLIRIPAMRGSSYVLPRDLVPAGLALARASSGARWLRPALEKGGLRATAIEKLTTKIERLVRGGPMTAGEIRKGLRNWKDPFPQALTLLLRHLTYEGRVEVLGVRGGWRSQTYAYGIPEGWMALSRKLPSPEQALARLAPMYFEANGPATIENFAWWAGVSPSAARRIAVIMDLLPVSVEGLDEEHLATRANLEDLGSTPFVRSTNLLPYWDAYVMAQADRRRYLDPKWADRVVDRSGNATNVILKEGRIAGIWDVIRDTIRFAPFEPVRVGEVRDAGARLKVLHPFRKIERVRIPGPLSARGQNAFLSPLR